jgi:hypothetical protein
MVRSAADRRSHLRRGLFHPQPNQKSITQRVSQIESVRNLVNFDDVRPRLRGVLASQVLDGGGEATTIQIEMCEAIDDPGQNGRRHRTWARTVQCRCRARISAGPLLLKQSPAVTREWLLLTKVVC